MDSDVADVAAKIVARMALEWRDKTRPDDEGDRRRAPRHGRLREIIDKHKGVASRICQSLVVVNVDVGVNNDDNNDNDKVATLTPASLVETQMRVNIKGESSRASWFVISVFLLSSSHAP